MGKNFIPKIIDKDWQTLIQCPKCFEDYVHFDEPRIFNGYDSYFAKGIYGWTGRGSLIVVPMWCEACGCSSNDHVYFYFCIGFHKGNTAVWVFTPDENDGLFNPNNKFSER